MDTSRGTGWTIIDAGWMAMSRDRRTAADVLSQGYGLVCALDGSPIPDLIVVAASQEHGVIAPRPGSGATMPEVPVGAPIRVLPNHACATAAQFDRYYVVRDGVVDAEWPRFGGWESRTETLARAFRGGGCRTRASAGRSRSRPGASA